jgi:hypothetical protein
MGFGTIEQLIAKGQPSPITSTLQGFQTGAQMMPSIRMAQLAPALRQAQIAQARAAGMGQFEKEVGGILDLAKQRGLTPEQTRNLLDIFQATKQRGGISLGLGAGGQLTSLQIGGTPGAGGMTTGTSSLPGVLAPTAVVPNTGQTSRGTAGATKINPMTGEVTSIPTRATGGFLQQGIVGNQKYQEGLKSYQKAMTPYIGVNGHLAYGKDLLLSNAPKSLLSIFPGGKEAQQEASKRLGNYDAAKGSAIGIATDAARMSSGKAPTEAEIKKWLDSINPNYWGNIERFSNHIAGMAKLGNTWAGTVQKGLETGIPVGQLSPEEQQALLAAQQTQAQQASLGKIFFPDEEHAAHIHAMMQPQHHINGVPHLKPEQTRALAQQPAQAVTSRIRVQRPDGRVGTIPATNLQAALRAGYKRVSQ